MEAGSEYSSRLNGHMREGLRPARDTAEPASDLHLYPKHGAPVVCLFTLPLVAHTDVLARQQGCVQGQSQRRMKADWAAECPRPCHSPCQTYHWLKILEKPLQFYKYNMSAYSCPVPAVNVSLLLQPATRDCTYRLSQVPVLVELLFTL